MPKVGPDDFPFDFGFIELKILLNEHKYRVINNK